MKRLAILLPIWLVFAIGEPSLVHRCPTHDVASLLPPDASHHGGHQADAPAPDSHSKHGCSCIGACTIVPVAVASRSPSAPTAPVTSYEPVVPAAPQFEARRDAHRALPYANGPPA